MADVNVMALPGLRWPKIAGHCAGRIWCSEVESSGCGDLDMPGAGVDEAVVVAAEQEHVVGGGGAAVDPVGDVVGVAHDRWAGAVREAAVVVAGDEGFPDGGGGQANLAADVEHL